MPVVVYVVMKEVIDAKWVPYYRARQCPTFLSKLAAHSYIAERMAKQPALKLRVQKYIPA